MRRLTLSHYSSRKHSWLKSWPRKRWESCWEEFWEVANPLSAEFTVLGKIKFFRIPHQQHCIRHPIHPQSSFIMALGSLAGETESMQPGDHSVLKSVHLHTATVCHLQRYQQPSRFSTLPRFDLY
jgi:hypothetical protein